MELILDLILTNAPHRIQNLHVDDTLCSQYSDHFLISANILNSCRSAHSTYSTQHILLYSKADFISMERFLDSATDAYLTAMLNKHGPSYLKWMLTDSCKQFIPKFKIPHKPTPRNCTQTLRRLYKRKPMPNNYTKLLHMESRLQASIQSSRNEYLQRLASLFQANPKILYEHLKQLSNSKFKPRFIVNNDTAIHDPKQMAEIFSHYFHSTFTTSDFNISPN